MKPLPMIAPDTPQPPAGNETAAIVADAAKTDALKPAIIAAISTVFDPEIPVNIWELGLIYDVKVDPAGAVAIRMTLTSPACPVAGSLPGEVEAKVRAVPGVTAARIELVWDPPWDKEMMSEVAKLKLGFL